MPITTQCPSLPSAHHCPVPITTQCPSLPNAHHCPVPITTQCPSLPSAHHCPVPITTQCPSLPITAQCPSLPSAHRPVCSRGEFLLYTLSGSLLLSCTKLYVYCCVMHTHTHKVHTRITIHRHTHTPTHKRCITVHSKKIFVTLANVIRLNAMQILCGIWRMGEEYELPLYHRCAIKDRVEGEGGGGLEVGLGRCVVGWRVCHLCLHVM